MHLIDFEIIMIFFRTVITYIKRSISDAYHYARTSMLYKNVTIEYPVNIIKDSSFEGMNRICYGTTFKGSMGLGSYIGQNCILSAEIGRFCSIANNVKCNPGIHPYKEPFVTTSPNFFSLMKQSGNTFATKQMFEEFRYFDKEKKIAVKIENDVWIGENVFLVGGIKIENGAMILAGAVVTKNVPAYAIVGGVPARIIGYRYDDEPTRDFLQKTKWWNNDKQWFKENWQLLCDIDNFKKCYDED